MKKGIGYIFATIGFVIIVTITLLNYPFRTAAFSPLDPDCGFFQLLDLRYHCVHWVLFPLGLFFIPCAYVVQWADI